MLKRIPQALLILIALSCASGGHAQTPAAATFKVGVASRHVLPPEPYEWRGAAGHSLQEIVWYPADSGAEPKPQLFGPPGAALFAGGDAAPDAKLAASPAKFPLILLSHGTGGTAEAMAWLGTALAARGYVVAAVNHPGNNARAPYTVPGFTLWWKRAQDLTEVASDLLADDEFGPRIDPRRIGAAGFSLGGYTVIELAGGITSLDQFFAACRGGADRTSCEPPPEFADLINKSKALAETDPAFAQALRGDGASYRDPRVRAVFAMAPAVGLAVTPASLGAIAVPVAIVAGEQDSVAPIAANAKLYAASIPHAQLTVFPGAVDHYVFMDVCTEAGRSTIPSLCVDRPGIDREAIHDATIKLAVKFFGEHL